MPEINSKHIAVVIPCYNEAVTIVSVVEGFRAQLPEADIYVFDNNSTDDSVQLARQAGAIVHKVRNQGKGNVLQAALEVVVADALVLVDGDDTYFPEDVHNLLEPVLSGEVDMVVGNRLASASDENMRRLHHLGNKMIVNSINLMFGTHYLDILSGYRVFSRRFVENVPLLTPGFETETEMTLQALEEGMIIIEMPISYRSRPADSHSKLNSFRDGYRIMLTAAILLRDHNPLRIFGLAASISVLAAFVLWLLSSFANRGILDLNTPMLLLGIAVLILLSALSFGLGLILNAINTRFRQQKQLSQRKKVIDV
jgi:glycosyltransferase involved in cell wall biosynthesis